MTKRKRIYTRFEWLKQHVDYREDSCLLWPFPNNSYQGRPMVALPPDLRKRSHVRRAHAVMCELAHGPAPADRQHAAHLCGKGHLGCVNPRHLAWKSARENMQDKHRHGTMRAGGRYTRLTNEQIAEIRSRELSQEAYAAKFGVALITVQYWQNRPYAERRYRAFNQVA